MAQIREQYLVLDRKSNRWILSEKASPMPVPLSIYLLHHAHGGTDRTSTEAVLNAKRHALRIVRERQGLSKYRPHQGRRECARRASR
jgi:hypothetical protein